MGGKRTNRIDALKISKIEIDGIGYKIEPTLVMQREYPVNPFKISLSHGEITIGHFKSKLIKS